MNAVLADSSFWVGLRHPRDQHHERAKRIARELLARRISLVTTPLIFAEVHAAFSRMPLLRERVIRDFWENPTVQIEDVDRADQRAALELLRAHADKAYSFCDACSFTVMERLELREVASFDDHFRQIGRFEVIGLE
jgi:predicted nucleic acid-binding protein